MKKTIAAFFAVACAATLLAQQPVGLKNNLAPVADAKTYVVAGYNGTQMDKEDNAPKNGMAQPLSVGRLISSAITSANAGEWVQVSGGRLWRLQVKLDGAKGVSFLGKIYSLPQGASISIYNPTGSEVANTYTANDAQVQNIISSETITGQQAVIEYFEPTGQEGKGSFVIEKLGYVYTLTPKTDFQRKNGFGTSGSCEVNVNCSEGTKWQHQKKSVVRIHCLTDFNIQWCTGTLINTADKKFKPYILTAMHCGINSSGDKLINDTMFKYWLFYFNYEAPTCATPVGEGNLADQKITGSQVLAYSDDRGGELGSDFLLMKLNQNVPYSYNPYYAGWTIDTTNQFMDGVSIHHPAGDIKKISTYTWPLSPGAPYQTSPDKTHWQVLWSATTNGHGVTEGGSSGSPIFNENGYLVGTLTGGNSSCSKTNELDMYGRMDWHWTRNGSAANRRLKDWLDSANTGAITVDGAYPEPDGIKEITKRNALQIYPNPAGDWVYFSHNQMDGEALHVTVANVLGEQLVSVDTNGWLKVDALPAGVYIITAKDGAAIYTGKFIKQ